MAQQVSTFRGVLDFLAEIGVYDVVLPFLLVFTIVFAVLEKSKVLGTESIGGKEYTRKNLNSIVAFVIAFLVVASSRLVAAINESLANIILLLLVIICFLLLIGAFHKEGEPIALAGGWKTFFMVIMFIGVVLIFLQAIKTKAGVGLLEHAWSYLVSNWETNFTAGVIFVVVIVIFMLIVVWPKKESTSKPSE